MATNGRNFKAQLGAWAKQTQENLDALARQSAMQVSENVVRGTPVDTGFLRGSWQPSIGAPSTDEGEPDKSGAGRMAQIGLTIADMGAGDRFYLMNSAAYAMRLEYGFVGKDSLGRNINQTGRFFVQDNVARWPQVVAQIAAELKLKK